MASALYILLQGEGIEAIFGVAVESLVFSCSPFVYNYSFTRSLVAKQI